MLPSIPWSKFRASSRKSPKGGGGGGAKISLQKKYIYIYFFLGGAINLATLMHSNGHLYCWSFKGGEICQGE